MKNNFKSLLSAFIPTVKKMLWLGNLKIVFKMYISYFLILLILLGISLFAIQQMSQVRDLMDRMYNRFVPVFDLTYLSGQFSQLNSNLEAAIITSSKDNQKRLIEQSQADIKEIDQIIEKYQNFLNQNKDYVDANDYQTFVAIWNGYKKDMEKLVEWVNSGDVSNLSEGITAFDVTRGIFESSLTPKIDGLNNFLKKWVDDNRKRAEDRYQSALEIQNTIREQLIIWMVVSVVVGLLIGWVVSRAIVTPLKQLVDAANQIADGDLRQHVPIRQKDEIGHLAATFNRMTENIKGLLLQVDEISSRVASFSEELRANAETTAYASEQIAATTMKTSEGVEKQADHVAVTKETIGEMRTGLDHIVNNIEEVVQQSESTNQASESGAMAVTKAVEQMKTIQDSTREAGQAVQQLQNYAQQITKVIELINNIARQTNLLSLNASIEAARAGEAGRGFAVVANEIRSLSAQTTSATSEIEAVIGQILNEIGISADKMKTGENQVEVGMTEIEHVNEAFDRIKQAIQQLTGKIEEVSGTVEEMAAGSEQVFQSMDVVDEHAQASLQAVKEIASSAQQQTASMEEVTAASADLAESAQQLREVLERFKI